MTHSRLLSAACCRILWIDSADEKRAWKYMKVVARVCTNISNASSWHTGCFHCPDMVLKSAVVSASGNSHARLPFQGTRHLALANLARFSRNRTTVARQYQFSRACWYFVRTISREFSISPAWICDFRILSSMSERAENGIMT